MHTGYIIPYNASSIPDTYSLGNTVWGCYNSGIGFFRSREPDTRVPRVVLPIPRRLIVCSQGNTLITIVVNGVDFLTI